MGLFFFNMKLVILVPLFLLFVACSFGAHVPEGFMTCGSECISDYNCSRYLGNPCTFCDRGKCSPMCGVGCGSSEDCIGGGNPCTYCSERRICINPVPQCGSFCGGTDEACRFASGECGGILENCCTCHPSNFTLGCGNYTMINRCGKSCSTSSDCANSGDGCVYCTDGVCSKDQSLCGEVCSGSGQCSASASCPQCVGYFCSPPASCDKYVYLVDNVKVILVIVKLVLELFVLIMHLVVVVEEMIGVHQ